MNIYVIGDSISIQYGPYLKSYLSGIIGYARKEGEEEAALNLDNPQGANGGDSGMVLSFLKAKACSGGIPADVLLVNCGLHDIKVNPLTGVKQISPGQYRENLEKILQQAKSMGLGVVWMRTTPCDERIHNKRPDMPFHRFAADGVAYNAIADTVMKSAGIPVIDLYSFTVNLGEELYCDHVHFHEPVRMKQAAFIAGWLQGRFVSGTAS